MNSFVFVFSGFSVDEHGFHHKDQHVLVPTSLVTGTIHLIAEKHHEHVQSKKKVEPIVAVAPLAVSSAPSQPSSKRPTILEFMTKPKTKRSIDAPKGDCGCKGKISIADGIAEHVVDRNFGQNARVSLVQRERELEEGLGTVVHRQISKRSTDDNADRRNPPPCSSSSCFAFPPRQSPQPQSFCEDGNCD